MTCRRSDGVRRLAAAAVVGVLVTVPTAARAVAADDGVTRITAPEELGEAVTHRSVDLDGRVVELASVSQDLDGTARVAEAEDTVDVVLDGNVLFGKDSAAILPAARARLREVVAVLREHGPGSVRIVGHTDDLGSAAHGLVLSRQRAGSVRDVLAPQLDGYRITTDGRGEAEPRVPNTDEASRAMNRRVEIHYERR